MFKRTVSFVLMISFVFAQAGFCQPMGLSDISGVAAVSVAGDLFRPAHLRSLAYDPDAGLDLLIDKGDAGTGPNEETARKLLEYFRIGITLPNTVFFVNLRPDSPETMIAAELARTDMGRILLEADLRLKKDFCSFTSPTCREGREYWKRLYARAESLYRGERISIPTMSRPWIVPGEIIVREGHATAYIYKATLRVRLEQDHLGNDPRYAFADARQKELNEYSSVLLKEIVLPKLNRKINSSASYASLRQVYYSLIFAQWFKRRFTGTAGAFASRIDSSDLSGLVSKNAWRPMEYFQAYATSFSRGEYRKETRGEGAEGIIVRTFTAGGIAFGSCFTGSSRQTGLVDIAGKGAYAAVLEDPGQMMKVRASREGTVVITSAVYPAGVTDGGSAQLEQPEPSGVDIQSLLALLDKPDELLFESRHKPHLLLAAIRRLENKDPKDFAKLELLYITALQVKYLQTPPVIPEDVAHAALNPRDAGDVENAKNNARRIAEATAVADSFSVDRRLEICRKLKALNMREPKNGFVDYHTHSFRSDGEFSPSYNLYYAWKKGMRLIAVTDHNTDNHFDEVMRAAVTFDDLIVVPGIEVDVSTGPLTVVKGKPQSLEYVHMPLYFPPVKGANSQEFRDEWTRFKSTKAYGFLRQRYEMNNGKLELMRQRFNASETAADSNLRISLNDWARLATDFPNWGQIEAVLRKIYGSAAIDAVVVGKDAQSILVNDNRVKGANPDDATVRSRRINFWENYGEKFGIDLAVLLDSIKDLKGLRLSLAHPTEERNVWPAYKQRPDKKNPDADIIRYQGAEQKARLLYDVLATLMGNEAYAGLKERLWAIELYSSKHPKDEIREFEKMIVALEGLLGRKLYRLIASDTHHNNYEKEGGIYIGTGKNDNLVLKAGEWDPVLVTPLEKDGGRTTEERGVAAKGHKNEAAGGEKEGTTADPAEVSGSRTPGGIDMSALSIVSRPLALADGKIDSSLESLGPGAFSSHWKELKKRVKMGLAPYGEIRQFIAVCVIRQQRRQLTQVHKFIADTLRKEELTGEESCAGIKEIILALE